MRVRVGVGVRARVRAVGHLEHLLDNRLVHLRARHLGR